MEIIWSISGNYKSILAFLKHLKEFYLSIIKRMSILLSFLYKAFPHPLYLIHAILIARLDLSLIQVL